MSHSSLPPGRLLEPVSGSRRGRGWPTPATLERLIVMVLALSFGLTTMLLARSMVEVFITPDGAHAITDALGLVGLAPRGTYYLPGWPSLLLPLLLAGVPLTEAVQAGLGLLIGLLFVALYVYVRPLTSPRAALVGATVGTGSSVVAELLSWQGGATLLALVVAVFALASFERWQRLGRAREGVLTGLALGLVLATHPFMALVAAGLLELRWLAAVRQDGFTARGFGPTSPAGLVVAAVVPLLAAALLLPLYLAINVPSGSGLRPPDLAATWQIIVWATRESAAVTMLLIILALAALSAPIRTRFVALGIVALVVLLPALLSGDGSYQSRVAYLLPILYALGGAHLWQILDPGRPGIGVSVSWLGRLGRRWSPVVAAALVISLGFPTRLGNGVAYYATLSAQDVSSLRSLREGAGTIVTSWTQNLYWDGMGKSWYAEAFANRPAIGPADPAMSTKLVESGDSAAAWQLFSGEMGVQNGGLQVSFGPSGWRADPAIAANINGYYLPFLYINDGVNDYGAKLKLAPGTLAWTIGPDGVGRGSRTNVPTPPFSIISRLDGNQVSLDWTRPTGGSSAAWTIWVWPAYGLPWRDVATTATTATFAPMANADVRDKGAWFAADPRISLAVSGGATLEYVVNDPAFHVQTMKISVPAGADLHLVATVSGTRATGELSSYSEREVIRARNITTVAVWTDTGWSNRFSTSPCFSPMATTGSLTLFAVTAACHP